ncbi:hypothetical protein A5727_21795 [Mycobacterium sp. ACS4331]|nr:hypothetical protein A5727_21795 [Mycobacterium sp. ACS4331]
MVIAVSILLVLVSFANGEKDKRSSSSSNASSISTSRTTAAAPAPTRSEVVPTTTEPPKPSFTPAQRNAIKSAESYLDYAAFSKQGLIDQLEYGDFSTSDATFAVEYIEANGGVDWNEQAVKSARQYLEYTSFSLQALVEQLEYSGFTPAEAQYGANQAYGE